MKKTKVSIENYHRFLIYSPDISLKEFKKLIESRCNYEIDSFSILSLTKKQTEIKKESEWEFVRKNYIGKVFPIKKSLKKSENPIKHSPGISEAKTPYVLPSSPVILYKFDEDKLKSFKGDLLSGIPIIKPIKKEEKEDIKTDEEELKEKINSYLQYVLQHDQESENIHQIDFSLFGLYKIIQNEKKIFPFEYTHQKLLKCPGVEGFLNVVGYEKGENSIILNSKIIGKDIILNEIKSNISEKEIKFLSKSHTKEEFEYDENQKKMVQDIYNEYYKAFISEYNIEKIIQKLNEKLMSLKDPQWKEIYQNEMNNLINLERNF